MGIDWQLCSRLILVIADEITGCLATFKTMRGDFEAYQAGSWFLAANIV
jgi:hypothetical protein